MKSATAEEIHDNVMGHLRRSNELATSGKKKVVSQHFSVDLCLAFTLKDAYISIASTSFITSAIRIVGLPPVALQGIGSAWMYGWEVFHLHP